MSNNTWHCRTHHSHLVSYKGSLEDECLALECHEFLHTIEPTLQNVLQFTAPPPSVSLMDAMPVLALFFNFYYNAARENPPTTEADRPRMLQAFGRLMRFSHQLNASPPVKTAFWTTLASVVGRRDACYLHKELFGLPQFPQFAIHGGCERYAGWSTVNESLCDAVSDFLTTPVDEVSGTSPIPLGLSFANEEPMLQLTAEHFQRIERMLDNISTSPTQQYKLTVLDLINNIMNAPELEVAARIMAKCKGGFYQVEQFKLDSALPFLSMAGYSSSDTPREYLDIMSAAFSPAALPQFWSFRPPLDLPVRADPSPSVVRKVSFNKNVLTQRFYPEHFSTLRYGCPLEEDLTDYSIETRYQEEISIDCWRWLAFGLFYPRPKRFAQAYKLRTIGKLTLDPIAIRTIVNTIRNPVPQLVHNDLDGADTSVADCLMVCTVKEGAEIQVFVSGLKYEIFSDELRDIEPWDMTLLETSELEALCEREDGSVCVVVPGAGLGWVAKDDVVLLEREPLDRSAQEGLYHATMGPSQNKTHVGELQPLFNTIGRQLCSLTVDFSLRVRGIHGVYSFDYDAPVQATVMQFIRDYCVHVRHLNLNGTTADEMSDLLAALGSSDLGSRLLTLNLNAHNHPSDNDAVVRLASILGDTARLPALRELRLNHYGMNREAMLGLHNALSVNWNLALIELQQASESTIDDLLELQTQLDRAFQGSPLPCNPSSLSPEDALESPSLTNTNPRRTIAWGEKIEYY